MPQAPPLRRAASLGIEAELRVIRNDGWRMAPHWHADIQVIASIAGRAEVVLDESAQRQLSPGSLMVIPPRASHTAYGTGLGDWTFYSLYLPPDRLAGADSKPFGGFIARRDDRLTIAFAALIETLVGKSAHNARARFAVFVEELRLRIEAAAAAPNAGRRDAFAASAARMVADLRSNVSIPQLAAQHGMSVGHFSRKFRDVYGSPPHTWRLIARVEAAKRYLRSGETVARAAEFSGFRDSNHLGRVCKSWTGLTPRAFKQ